MNKKYLLFLLIVVFFLSGCATRTRIGAFIPAHLNSDQRSGEEVWLHIAKSSTSEEGQKPFVAIPLAAAFASHVIGMGIDYLKSELQEEAKNYDASYGAKAWLTTDQLKDGEIIILLTRWVDKPLLGPTRPEKYDENLNEALNIITGKGYQIISRTGTVTDFTRTDEVTKSKLKEITNKKYLAFAYALKIKPDPGLKANDFGQMIADMIADECEKDANTLQQQSGTAKTNKCNKKNIDTPEEVAITPFLVEPVWIWQWLTKAKIVSLSPNPLSWPATIFLRTGSEAEYNVRLTIEGLVKDRNSDIAQMSSLGIKDPVHGPSRFDLSQNGKLTKFENPDKYGWIAIPGYPSSTSRGYLSIQLTVNESDPSNVKKTILKGSDYLEANRDNIINSLNPIK